MSIKKLFKTERGTHTEMRTVKRGGKTFKRKTRVGTKEKDKVTIPTKEEFYSKEYWYDPKRGRHPASGSGKLPSKEFAQIEIRDIGGEPAIRIYNPWTKEEIVYYDLDQMDEAKERFKNLYDETFGKLEMIDVTKLMRGTHKEKVPVKRETGTKYEYRRVGRKESPRKGTGKMDKFPESIKKEILAQRSIGESGVKIKEFIEGMITQVRTGTPEQEKKIVLLNNKILSLSQKAAHKDTTQDEKKKIRDERNSILDQEIKLRNEMRGEIKTHIDGKSTGRDLIKDGLITPDGKLTVTSQALTDWSRKQGVESKKKRTSAVEAEKVKHEDTKKELDRTNRKISELEVKSKHNLEEIKLIQQSKQESDRIRQQLGKDNIDLKSKLKVCLGDKK